MTLDNFVKLHEIVEIHYVVYDPMYEVTLLTDDGQRPVAVGRGDSIQDALTQLTQKVCSNFTDLVHLRTVPKPELL